MSIVLENDEKKAVSYAEWLRQKKSQPTFRSMLEADLHDAIEDANDLGHFFLLMEHKGYEIHHGKRLGFRLRGQEHFLCPERRNPTFSEERTGHSGQSGANRSRKKTCLHAEAKAAAIPPTSKVHRIPCAVLSLLLFARSDRKTAVPAAHVAAPAKRDYEG